MHILALILLSPWIMGTVGLVLSAILSVIDGEEGY